MGQNSDKMKKHEQNKNRYPVDESVFHHTIYKEVFFRKENVCQ